MGKIKIKISPLFFLFGFYYALTGRIITFIIYTVCAVEHEIGHSIVAANSGYRLNEIKLMPFGATVKGNIEGLKPVDEFKIAIAGPLTNLFTGLLFVACWWIFPETYPFTDVIAEACFSIAAVNFIPILPLDGGRVTCSVLAGKYGRKKAKKISKITSMVFAAVLFVLGIISAILTFNLSFLFFSLFVFFANFGKSEENEYVKLYSGLSEETLKRGVTVKRQAVDESVSIKKLIRVLDADAVNEILVYKNGKERAKLSQERLSEIIKKGDIYSPISKYV